MSSRAQRAPALRPHVIPSGASASAATTCHPERNERLRREHVSSRAQRAPSPQPHVIPSAASVASGVEGSPARRMPARGCCQGTVFGLVADAGPAWARRRNGIPTRGIPGMPRVQIPFLRRNRGCHESKYGTRAPATGTPRLPRVRIPFPSRSEKYARR